MPSALRRLLRISGLGTAVALVYGLARSTRRPSPPDPSGIASWPPLVNEPEVEIRNGPVRFATVPAANETVADERSQAPTSPTWVEPTNGMCPDSHPIKGNAGSMIFHVPGGRSYERTHAERCYCTAQHAEDDGFRQAKR